MGDLLKILVDRLGRQEEAILAELTTMEAPAMATLEGCRAALRSSPVAQSSLSLNESFELTENFSSRLLTAAECSAAALDKVQCSVKVVDKVGCIYDLGSRILSSYESGDAAAGGEDISRFIAAVEEAKRGGYWEEVAKVASCGHISEVMRGLRAFVIQQLRAERPSAQSQLFTRLAVTLQAGSEAYESYLKIVREKMRGAGTDNRAGTDSAKLERIIKSASALLLGQGQAVHSELGSADYIRICREIHVATSAEACEVLRAFLLAGFGAFITAPDGDVEALVSQVEAGMDSPEQLGAYAADLKTVDRVLDDIASLSSLWCDYETSFRAVLAPVYRALLVQRAADAEFGSDSLGEVSRATHALQSILSFYVRLEHASVTRGLEHAINYDSVYMTSAEDGFSVATSTLVDESFFVLQKAQQRAVATGDVQAACATLNQVNDIIQDALKEGLVRNLLDSQGIYKAFIEVPDNLQRGSWYVMLQQHFERAKQPLPDSLPSRFSFIHCVNNIEECVNFLGKFKAEIAASFQREFRQLGSHSLLVESTVESLDSVLGEFDQLLDLACKCTLNILKFHVTDPLNRFNEIDFNCDEESYTSYLSENPFVEDLIAVLRAVFGHLSALYSPATGARCVDDLVERICKFMEHSILSKRFTIYGAVYLDGAVRSLMQVCTAHDQRTRRQFSSLLLISDVLNCGSRAELSQFKDKNASEFVEQYFALRTDLEAADPASA
ncbi:conserved oligomeric Golgi complex protein [Babesia caballi]|uniref:Conserved oligomeric Golgi complex protein n=1 Tax=Babesia caballi TaxID=5871 RepID=A0AAV4M0Q1_BABCB|nr:conserved oligomeric Golgi complex protein [Babesia caballi]